MIEELGELIMPLRLAV